MTLTKLKNNKLEAQILTFFIWGHGDENNKKIIAN